MKKTVFYTVLGLLCNFFTGDLFANRLPGALSIGDTLPVLSVGNVLNYPSGNFKTADFKDTLLLLDFWATSCGNCIEAMPELAALQQQFSGKMQVFCVGYESKERITKFFSFHPELTGLGLPVVTGDTLLKRLFPHQFIPHIVWVLNGKYIAATEADYVTAANITKMLAGAVQVKQKNDALQVNYHEPLMQPAVQQGLKGAGAIYYSALTPYLNGLPPSMGRSIDSVHKTVRFYAVNQPVLNLYALALSSSLPLTASRRIFAVPDSSYIYRPGVSYLDAWSALHTWCYENVMPLSAASSAFKGQLLATLNGSLSLNGRIEYRDVHCLLLRKAGKTAEESRYRDKAVQLEQGRPLIFHNGAVADLVFAMNSLPGMPPVIDDVHYLRAFDLGMAALPADATAWISAIKGSGFKLIPAVRRMSMFILSRTDLAADAIPSAPPSNLLKPVSYE